MLWDYCCIDKLGELSADNFHENRKDGEISDIKYIVIVRRSINARYYSAVVLCVM